MNIFKTLLSVFALAAVFIFGGFAAQAQTTVFTYQGRLSDGAQAASGTYDLGFALFDAATGGTQIGTAQTRNAVSVSNGIFSVQLDFGANPFAAGANRFLEIAVKRPADTNYTTLTPRQQLTAAPFSIQSLSAKTADGLSANCVGCITDAQINSLDGAKISGTITNATVTNAVTAQNVSGIVAIANGGTGSAAQNFVDLTTAQTVAGAKTFSGAVKAPTFDADTQFNLGGSRILSNAGNLNLFVGVSSGPNSTGEGNSFVGSAAGQANTTGSVNTFIGVLAGTANTEGGNNVFVGGAAGRDTTTGSRNMFIGTFAGALNQTGRENSFAGQTAGQSNTTGNFNSFFGSAAGANTRTGSSNAMFGAFAGNANQTGSNNTFVGIAAGINNSSGSNNTMIGANTGIDGNLNFATAIGAGAAATTNNTVVIGRSADTVRVPGNFVVTGTTSGSGASLTNLDASNVTSGTLDNARLGIVAIANGGTGSATQNFVDTTTAQTIAGAKTFSDNLRTNNLLRSGSEIGNTNVPQIAGAIGAYNGLVTRRVNSNARTAGQTAARTNVLRLERDGTNGGWQIANDALNSFESPQSVHCLGISNAGAVVAARLFINTATAGTTVLYTNAQNIEYMQCSFGNLFSLGHQTQIVLQRSQSDYVWIGTLTSTFNQ